MVFPITTAPPSYMVVVRSKTRQSNVFYRAETGRTIDLLAFSADGNAQAALQAFTGAYNIRDYYGTLVASGTLNAATSLPIPDNLPCGGYRIHLTQSVNDATYGFAGGAGNFIVVNTDSRFPSMVGVTPANGTAIRGHLGDNCQMHGITLQGPRRDLVGDPTNSGYNTNIQIGAALDAQWYLAIPDPVRQRISSFVTNISLLTPGAQVTAWQADVAEFVDQRGINWFEGPANEPPGNAQTNSTDLQTFSSWTKAARPAAKVMGPSVVSFNSVYNPSTSSGYFHSFFTWLAAMNPYPIDGLSFHGYNCLNGDLSLGRKCYGALVDTITAHGMQDLPRFHTEQGFVAVEHGVFMPRLQGRWTMLMLLLQEQYGIPKEHHALFYDTATGDFGFPSQYAQGDTTYFPATTMMRAFSAEVWGKTHTTAFDFGTPGNDMLIGSVYTGSDGTSAVALQAAGSTDLTVKLTVTGTTSPLTVVDCFGNTSTTAVTAGAVTVPVPLEPVYLRLPAGVSVAVAHEWNAAVLGTDLARTATATASGTTANVTTNAARMVDGNQISTYYLNQSITARNQTNAPYVDDTNAFPAWARFDWASAQTLDRVVVFAAPPWQAQGTLLDFDVQWLDADGVTWHTERTITEKAKYGAVSDPTANVVGQVTNSLQNGCTVESFFSERWIFPVTFASKVTTKAIRLFIRGATYGMDATIEAKTAKGTADATTFGNNFTIRSVQAFNSNAAAPATSPRFLLRANALS